MSQKHDCDMVITVSRNRHKWNLPLSNNSWRY